MPLIHFELPDGSVQNVTVPIGESVMRAALNVSLPGIEAECGGSLTCATCHVHVLGDWYDRFEQPDAAEADLLEIVDDPRSNSRLSCQLILGDDTDGVVIGIP